jgi:hypothetical protein
VLGPAAVDLDRLLKLRLVVARIGEMDLARWWNCRGVLGQLGAQAYRRGFPTTHPFARARVAFAVARARCTELFDPPGAMTLWNLPADLEDAFKDRWQAWLDQPETWATVFEQLGAVRSPDLLDALANAGLLTPDQREAVGGLRRSAENRAVQIPGVHQPDEELITLLAAGFARGDLGAPAIPYARLEVVA